MMSAIDTTRRAAIYARYSSDRQSPTSIEDQIRDCMRWAERERVSIVDTFNDFELTGQIKARPGYEALKECIRRNAVDIVVVESLSRLTRDTEENAGLQKLCDWHEVKIHSLSEGQINSLSSAFHGMMSAEFLKQLAHATRRTLRGRIENGKSAGGLSFGYKIPRLENGDRLTGELEPDPEQVAVVLEIMQAYADGLSPHCIAARLNERGVPGPRGGTWSQSAINGNRGRGTGILNNELYVGYRIWNRLSYKRHPETEKRVSRPNPLSEIVVKAVPHLQIVPNDLWDAVKARQAALDAAAARRNMGDKNRLSGNQTNRRPAHLLSGLVRCGRCGGGMSVAGTHKPRYYCSNRKNRGTCVCEGMPGIEKSLLEARVLHGLKHHLMSKEAVDAHIREFHTELQRLNHQSHARRKVLEKKLNQNEKSIERIVDAIKAGLVSDALQSELLRLEEEKKRLKVDLSEVEPEFVVPESDIVEGYKTKVRELTDALNSDAHSRTNAATALRGLIEHITISWEEDAQHHMIEIEGDIVALLVAGGEESKNAASISRAARSLKLVAGAGFEPATFRL